jgi:simple sugar transport system permease protein
MWENLPDILRLSLFVAIPLLVVALAGLFSERSGVTNIALEGIMVIGAFTSAYFMGVIYEKTGLDGNVLFLIGMIIAMSFGMIFSVLHAYASVSMKADQIISGTALNLFAPAFAVFIAQSLTGYSKVSYPSNSFFIRETFLSDIPILGPIIFTKTWMSVYVGFFLLILAYIVLYKTRFGLRLRSCGEFPQASDAAGVNVKKMRYAGVLISGALAGLGGLFYIVPITGNYDANFGVYGYGFLALAVLISGQWKPFRILFIALLFGFVSKISSMTILIPFIYDMKLPTEILNALPFFVTLIVLAFTSKKSQAPRAVGEPYDPGKR